MNRINILDDLTINKIAAGEVVERPSSVVKELIENSIDAGSTKVVIDIQDGGKKLIRITDNGCGIASSEVDKSFLRHATSKIKNIDDLYDLYCSNIFNNNVEYIILFMINFIIVISIKIYKYIPLTSIDITFILFIYILHKFLSHHKFSFWHL